MSDLEVNRAGQQINKEGHYAYVAAALTPSMTCGTFYVTHGRTGVRHFEYIPLATGSIVKLPDRTIHFVYHPKYRPLDTAFDNCISFSPFEKGSWADMIGVTHFLISAYHGIGERIRDDSFKRNNLKMIADSGGAQLKFDVVDFVDPREILWWMNKCADIGMTLDFAPRPIDQTNKKALVALAQQSRKANLFFKKNKADKLKLVNITHGFELEQVRRWTDTVAMDGFDGWAAGADVMNNNLANLRNILQPIVEQDPVSHYHLFGFSGRKKTPAMAWIARKLDMQRDAKKLPKATLTSDSTTWLTMAKWRAFMTFDPRSGHSELLPVGKRHKLQKGLHIPCSCFICSQIGWLDYYDLPPQTHAGRALGLHNLFVLHQQVEFWNKQARIAKNVDEYLKIVDWAFGKKAEIRNMVSYVEEVFENGLDKADRRFRSVLHDRPTRLGMKRLFDNGGDDLSFVDMESATVNIKSYKDFDWKKEKVVSPFLNSRSSAKFDLLGDELNPDAPAEISIAEAEKLLGDDVEVPVTKKKGATAP